MKTFTFLIFAILFSLQMAFAESTGKVDSGASGKKSQIDDLFLWKVSDELKLPIKKEKELGELLKNLSGKRLKMNEQIEDLIESLAKADNDKNRDLRLKEYRRLVKAYSELNVQEIDDIQKVLGVKSFGQYLLIKQEFAGKIKNLLLQDKSKQ